MFRPGGGKLMPGVEIMCDYWNLFLETGAPELIWVASKSGSMNACRNDGGIVHTPYGEYVIVLMNKDFHDIIEYNEHPAMVYGARVSRMILDQVLACEGRLFLS